MQKAVDYIRDSVFTTDSDSPLSQDRVVGLDMHIHIPRCVLFINKQIDLTSIRKNFWNITGDRTVIVVQTAGKAGFDFMDSTNAIMEGITFLGDWTSLGVPTAAFQIGRKDSTSTASGHTFRDLEVIGKFSMACVHSYASELTSFSNCQLTNDLDSRRHYFSFDAGSAGTLVTSSAVTWSGGTGEIEGVDDDGATGDVVLLVHTGTLSDGTVITQTSDSKTFTIDGTPVAEPAGDGVGGRSYGLLQDGENVFGITSDTHTDPTVGVAASFLGNTGDKMIVRHEGRGDAMLLCRDRNHRYSGSYFVSTDYDGGAAVVLYSNGPTDLAVNLQMAGCHFETDLGDTDVLTGIDYGFKIDSVSSGQATTLSGLVYRDNTSNVSLSTFGTTSNIDSVKMVSCDIVIDNVNRNNGQKMFGDPSKFSVDGLIRSDDVSNDYINIAELNSFSGEVRVNSVEDTASHHATSSYKIGDSTNSAYLNTLTTMIDGSGNFDLVTVDRSNSELANIKTSSSGFTFGVAGTDTITLTASGLYPSTTGTEQLGLGSRQWDKVHAEQYRVSNVKVVGSQESAIADSTGGADDQTKINAVLAALRSHGLIDT